MVYKKQLLAPSKNERATEPCKSDGSSFCLGYGMVCVLVCTFSFRAFKNFVAVMYILRRDNSSTPGTDGKRHQTMSKRTTHRSGCHYTSMQTAQYRRSRWRTPSHCRGRRETEEEKRFGAVRGTRTKLTPCSTWIPNESHPASASARVALAGFIYHGSSPL